MYRRTEYKYLIPYHLIDDIRAEIWPYVNVDEFAREREQAEYTVRSIYLDTPQLNFYNEKIEGLKVRRKLRIRGYNEFHQDNLIFLEIKRKYVNFVDKNRAPLRQGNLAGLMQTHEFEQFVISLSGHGQEVENAYRFFFHLLKRGLQPTCLVIYEREAFFNKFDPGFRLTFDKNVRSSLYPSLDKLHSEDAIRYALPNYFILEMKFDHGIPSWMRSLIRRYEFTRLALSKYTICLDSHMRRHALHNYRVHQPIWQD